MATISYRIKEPSKDTKTVRDWVNVRVRFQQFEISTGIKVNRKHWSPAKQRVKTMRDADYSDEVNGKLDGLRTFLNKEIVIAQTTDDILNQNWFSDCVKKFFNKPTSKQEDYEIFFVPYMKRFIEKQEKTINKKTGKPRSKGTIKDYNTKLNRICDYEKKKGKRLKHIDLDLNFLKEFNDFQEKEYLLTNNNTLDGFINVYKQVSRDAKRAGIRVSDELEHPDFYVPLQKTHNFALTEDEIFKIYNHDFSKNERLDNARDWFVIGLWTGLRISDFLKLQKSDIEDGFISIFNRKTDIPVIIPLHENVEAILAKRKGAFPRKISDQKFNDYAKEVCKEVGMTEIIDGAKKIPIKAGGKTFYRKKFGNYPKNELITSHICRRTFATIHYGRLDTLTIMQITGHKTEKQFIDYVKIPPKTYAERLKRLWKNQKEHEQNKKLRNDPKENAKHS
jgi:integrase